VDRFAIAGTASDCVAQIARAQAAGAHQFIITGFVPDPRSFMRRWAEEVAGALVEMANDLGGKPLPARLEDLERNLTVLEDKLFAVLLAAIADKEVVAVRAQADRELAPYRSRMPAAQIEQLQKQYLHKKLLERYGLPRLSLFYM